MTSAEREALIEILALIETAAAAMRAIEQAARRIGIEVSIEICTSTTDNQQAAQAAK